MNKFEKLIELVNEGEEAKAEELFHDIVVDTSRGIYESLMNSEDGMGGDEADELMNDIAADEEGMREDDDEMAMEPEMDDMGSDFDDSGDMDSHEMDHEMGDEEDADLEDRVVDLEDQLDALMAEFDSVMGDEEGMEPEMGDEMEPEMGDEFGGEEELAAGAYESVEEDADALEEAVSLTKVTKGISNSSEAEGTNKTSVNANNSGAKGAAAKPHQTTGEDNGRANPEVKAGDGTTEPNESKVSEPKKKGEDAGVNKKSISGS